MTDARSPARQLLPLALIFLSVGLSTAMAAPFLTLFLTTAVHATPLQVTAFLVAAPLSSVLTSTLIGRLSDRRPIRHRLIIAAALTGSAGALLTSEIRNYWALLALTVTATAAAGSLLPQLFAYARTALLGSDRAAMTMSSLRTVFSLSWVAGPFLATVLLGSGGFRLSYTVAAVMYALAAAIAWRLLPATPRAPQFPADPPAESVSAESAPMPYVPAGSPAPSPGSSGSSSGAPASFSGAPAPSSGAPWSSSAPPASSRLPSSSLRLTPASSRSTSVSWSRSRAGRPRRGTSTLVPAVRTLAPVSPAPAPTPPAPAGPAPGASRRVIFLTVAAFVLLQCASGLGVQSMSLFVTTDLGGGIGDAGVIMGVCAGLEIPLMLGFGWLSTRVPLRRLVLAGPAFSLAYGLSVAASTHIWQVAAAQLFAACTVALVQGLGVSYIQEMLPNHPGRASTLFTNAFPAGAMLAGPILGVAQHVGYRASYATAAGLAVLAFAVLKLARTRH